MMASLYQSCWTRGDEPIPRARWLSNRAGSTWWITLGTRVSLRFQQAPDHVRAVLRIQPHVLDLAGPREPAADHEVLGFDAGVICQAEFPERNLEMAAVGRMRVQ